MRSWGMGILTYFFGSYTSTHNKVYHQVPGSNKGSKALRFTETTFSQASCSGDGADASSGEHSPQ